MEEAPPNRYLISKSYVQKYSQNQQNFYQIIIDSKNIQNIVGNNK